MGPIAACGHLGAAAAEMTLHAFSIQIMAGAAIKRALAVESSLVFVKPGLPHIVNVAVVAICRSIAERAIKIMAAAAGFVFRGQPRIIVRRVAMIPGYTCGHLGAAAAEMALNAFSIQIMAGAAIKGACAVESSLVFVKPGLPQIVNVAVVAICRSIAERSIKIMAAATGFVFRGQPRTIVRRGAMVPGNACGHLGAAGAEMALNAFSIQIMTGGAIQGTGAVESSLVFVEPRPPGWVDVTVMATCRSIAERSIKVMACQAHRVLLGENHSAVGNGTMLPVASRRYLGAGRPEMALGAFGIQIMTGTTFKGAGTVKSGLIFVQPLPPHGMNVAVVATFRPVAKGSTQIMTAATGFVFRGQPRIIVRRRAMVPGYACGHLGAGRSEMTLGAFSIQIMA